MTAMLTDNLPLIAAAPGGIKKLRELILELAVRGKLVPQDPTDEHASRLVERIQSEKANFQNGGRTKKDIHFATVGAEEAPFRLPFGWAVARLGELFEIEDSLREPVNKAARDSRAGPYPYYGANGQVGFIDDFRFDGLRILVAEDGGFFDDPIRGVAYIAEGKYWVNNHAHVLRPLGASNPRFWVAFFNRLDWQPLVRGATRDKLNQTAMIQIPMVVPPLAEQHRIVTKVDELMTLCDRLESGQADSARAHQHLVTELLAPLTQSATSDDFAANWHRLSQHFDTLFTTEASIDALKKTILQLAVMGKLVPQDPNDESVGDLLKRIQIERVELAKEGKVRKENSSPSIGVDEKTFDIPIGWEWVRFEQIVSSRLGKMLDKAKNKGVSKPYLRNTNVQWFRFELDDIKEMRIEEREAEEYRVDVGDLLICEGGEPGRCAVWQGQLPEIYCQKALHRVRPYCGIVPEFLQAVLNVDAASGRLDQNFTGATIKHFSGEKLARYVLALPPVAEQRRIVSKVQEMMALCEAVRSRIVESNALEERLALTLVEQAVA